MASYNSILTARRGLESLLVEINIKINELQKAHDSIQLAIRALDSTEENQRKPDSIARLVALYIDELPAQAHFSTNDIISFLESKGVKDHHSLRMNVSCIVGRQLSKPGGFSRVKRGYFMKD